MCAEAVVLSSHLDFPVGRDCCEDTFCFLKTFWKCSSSSSEARIGGHYLCKKSHPQQRFKSPVRLSLSFSSVLVTMSFFLKKNTILVGGSSSVLFPVLVCSSRSNKTTSDFPPTHANISTNMTRHRVVYGCVFVVADERILPQGPFNGFLGRRYYADERIWDRECRNCNAYELPCMMWSITTRLGIKKYTPVHVRRVSPQFDVAYEGTGCCFDKRLCS